LEKLSDCSESVCEPLWGAVVGWCEILLREAVRGAVRRSESIAVFSGVGIFSGSF
jgi:hypothetical protein